ncbi:MAG: response regulator [Chloroflexi bacterium]|nr:response regulator [Chloroflexota bacterium]
MSGERILVAEDSPEVREFIADYVLKPAGYEVLVADDGAIAFRLAREKKPDLIIADWRMPNLDGLDLKRALTSHSINVPFILISGEATEEVIAQAALSNVSAFLRKPLKTDVLLKVVSYHLSQQRKSLPVADSTEKRVRELETLQSIGHALTSTLDLDQVLSRVVEAAVSLTDAEEGSLLLLDEYTHELVMRAARNFDDQFVRTFRLRSEDSLAGEVIRTGTPMLFGPNMPQKIKTSYLVRSLIYVPLRMQNRIFGVLGVDNRINARTFADTDVTTLNALADYAAIAIENARLYQHTNAERLKLEAILTHTGDGVIVVNDSNRIVLINAPARAVLNLDENHVAGKLVTDVIINQEVRDLLTHESAASPQKRTEIILDDNRVFNASLTSVPEVGRAVIMQDITHLKQLDRIKSEFVTTVSHDLRSPLTAILGYVGLLKRVGPINAQQDEFIKRIEISANAITTLITDLLDLGRIEAGFDTQKEPVSLARLAKHAADGLSPKAGLKGQKFVANIPESLPPVLGNAIRLRQMSANLIDNAIKYTPEGGTVTVNLLEADDQEIFTVSDTGIGIPLADQPYIFDKFYRAKGVPDTIQGTGLGLSIVKSSVENHGGRIWVDSKPNQGTTFTVVLPKYVEKKK